MHCADFVWASQRQPFHAGVETLGERLEWGKNQWLKSSFFFEVCLFVTGRKVPWIHLRFLPAPHLRACPCQGSIGKIWLLGWRRRCSQLVWWRISRPVWSLSQLCPGGWFGMVIIAVSFSNFLQGQNLKLTHHSQNTFLYNLRNLASNYVQLPKKRRKKLYL